MGVIPAHWLAVAVKVSIAFWGAAPCGPVHVRTHVVSRLPAGAPANTAAWTYDTSGQSLRESFRKGFAPCEIFYYSKTQPRWTYSRVCEATVHEIGHMTGHPHSSNPNSPMFDTIHPIPVCGAVRCSPTSAPARPSVISG
jgi:hypothetical protein